MATSAVADDWPQFRGPGRDNISKESGLLHKWPDAGPKVLWTTEVCQGYAAAAIYAGRVYFEDYGKDAKEWYLRCLALEDGKELWRFKESKVIRANHGITRAAPATDGKYVFSLDPKCVFHCLDAETGKELWRKDLVDDYKAQIPPWNNGQNPLIENDRVILGVGGECLLVALDKATGRELWRTPNPSQWPLSHASVMPAELAGERQYVWCTLFGPVGVRASDGQLLWHHDRKFNVAVAPSPLPLPGDRVFMTSGYDAGSVMLRVKKDGDKFTTETIFDWTAEQWNSEVHTPVLYQDHLFAIGKKNRGLFTCLDLDGKTVWTSEGQGEFDLGSFLLADGAFFILEGKTGMLRLVEATPAGYRELAHAQVLSGDNVWGPMALSSGRLVLRDMSKMVCLDVSGKSAARITPTDDVAAGLCTGRRRPDVPTLAAFLAHPRIPSFVPQRESDPLLWTSQRVLGGARGSASHVINCGFECGFGQQFWPVGREPLLDVGARVVPVQEPFATNSRMPDPVASRRARPTAAFRVVPAMALDPLVPGPFAGSGMNAKAANEPSSTDPAPPLPLQYRKVRTLAGEGRAPTQFVDELRGLAVDKDDRLYAIGDSRLVIFTAEGKLAQTWSTEKPGYCVAVAADGAVYVGEEGQVEVFSAKGERTALWADANRLALVTSIVPLKDLVLVADVGDRCIRRFDRSGKFLGNFEKSGRVRKFMLPNRYLDLAADAKGNVFVAHPGQHRVERYKPSGQFLDSFGRFDGQDPAGFSGCCNPTNLALFRDGRIAVSDKAPPQAKVYNADGELLALLGADDFDPNCKNMDLAVDAQDRVYVIDTVRLQILVFEPVGRPVPPPPADAAGRRDGPASTQPASPRP